MVERNTTPHGALYDTDIVLGERYRDAQTGYEGVATSVTFFQHACERVCVETYDPVRLAVKEAMFDAPRLTHIESGKVATATKTGGPGRAVPQASVPTRR